MKKITVLISTACLLFLQCGTPFSAREQCYEEEFCDTAGGDCLLGTLFINALLSPSSSSSSSSSSLSAGSTFSEFEPNDNFSTAISIFPSTTSLYSGRAGTIGSASDVDVYSVSFTSFLCRCQTRLQS